MPPPVDSDRWRSELEDHFAGLTTDSLSAGGAPYGNVLSLRLADISAHRVEGTEQVMARTPGAVRRRPSDLLKVCLVLAGRSTVQQGDVEVRAGAGEFVLYDTARPYRLVHEGSWTSAVLTVSRTDLAVSGPTLTALMSRPIPAASGVGAMFASYLGTLVSPDTTQQTTKGIHHVRTAGVALLNAALTQEAEVAAETAHDAMADQVLRFIEENLGDADLNVETAAAHLCLSVRTVQRLLASRQLTFSSVVRERRLAAIAQDLEDPALAHRTIGAVAARRGVLDQAWLSRSFRAAFGVGPRDYRRGRLSAASAGSP